jgi:hypothetical protein
MAVEVMVRSYGGESQWEAAGYYAEEVPRLAADGWVPVAQVWVAGEWPMSAWVASTVLIIAGIGIVLLAVLAIYKPVRTLMVTYQRTTPGAEPRP